MGRRTVLHLASVAKRAILTIDRAPAAKFTGDLMTLYVINITLNTSV